MDAVELAQRALQECFSRALAGLGEEAFDRLDRGLAAGLRRIRAHFNDSALLARACNLPLGPYSPSLPIALAAHLFAGARGADYPHAPDSCKALLEMGADPFAPSELPVGANALPGRYIFASARLNAFEIALAQSDGGLILALAPLLRQERFEPQHWTAYEIFCELPGPIGELCDQAMRSFAERGLLMSCIDGPAGAPSAAEEATAATGKGRKRL